MSKSITPFALAAALSCVTHLLLTLPAQAADPKEESAKLIAVLKSEADLKAKHDACRQLAVVGTAEAIPTLAGLLADAQLSHMACVW